MALRSTWNIRSMFIYTYIMYLHSYILIHPTILHLEIYVHYINIIPFPFPFSISSLRRVYSVTSDGGGDGAAVNICLCCHSRLYKHWFDVGGCEKPFTAMPFRPTATAAAVVPLPPSSLSYRITSWLPWNYGCVYEYYYYMWKRQMALHSNFQLYKCHTHTHTFEWKKVFDVLKRHKQQ